MGALSQNNCVTNSVDVSVTQKTSGAAPPSRIVNSRLPAFQYMNSSCSNGSKPQAPRAAPPHPGSRVQVRVHDWWLVE